MSDDPPSVIEFFGQPGAGKSTLVRAVASGSELPTKAKLGAAWERQSVFAKSAFVTRSMLDGACLSCAIRLVTGARLFNSDSLSRLVRLLIKSHWLRSQTGTLLLEEGHLQDLWSIFYSADRLEPNPRHLAPLMGCLYRGLDIKIIFLEVTAEQVFERIRGRADGKSRFDRLPEIELRQQAMTTAQLPLRIVAAAKMAGLAVETVDASLPIETTAGQLRAGMRAP